MSVIGKTAQNDCRTYRGDDMPGHLVRLVFAVSLLIAAFGLWLIPVEAGEAGMRLIKLFLSLALLGVAGACLAAQKR